MGRTVLIEVDLRNLDTDSANRVEALEDANNLSKFTEYLLNLYMQGSLVFNSKGNKELSIRDKESKQKSVEDDIGEQEGIILSTLEELKKVIKEVSGKDDKILEILEKGTVGISNFNPSNISNNNSEGGLMGVIKETEVKEKVKTKIIIGGNKGAGNKMANLGRLKKLKGDG